MTKNGQVSGFFRVLGKFYLNIVLKLRFSPKLAHFDIFSKKFDRIIVNILISDRYEQVLFCISSAIYIFIKVTPKFVPFGPRKNVVLQISVGVCKIAVISDNLYSEKRIRRGLDRGRVLIPSDIKREGAQIMLEQLWPLLWGQGEGRQKLTPPPRRQVPLIWPVTSYSIGTNRA